MCKEFRQITAVVPSTTTIFQQSFNDEVGNMAAFLASDLSRNVTGQTIFVDAGYNILGMAEFSS